MRKKWLRFIAFSSVVRMRRREQAERDRTRKKEKTTESERERESRRKGQRERETQTNSTNNTCAIGMNKNIYWDYLLCQRYIPIYMLVIPMTKGREKFVSTN